jgi:hypothetical protein
VAISWTFGRGGGVALGLEIVPHQVA